MRSIRRLPLSAATLRFLAKRSARVANAPAARAEARRLWRLQSNKAFRELRARLEEMALGRKRCMYCEDNQGSDIDHFRPKAEFPEDAFRWTNLLLACAICNSNYKRDAYPVGARGEPLLLDPTHDQPLDHLLLSPATGKLVPLSPRGVASRQVFALDREELLAGRRNAWTVLVELIPRYAAYRDRGDIATRAA